MLQLHFKPSPLKEDASEIRFRLTHSSHTNGTTCETILYRFLSEVMGLSRFEYASMRSESIAVHKVCGAL